MIADHIYRCFCVELGEDTITVSTSGIPSKGLPVGVKVISAGPGTVTLSPTMDVNVSVQVPVPSEKHFLPSQSQVEPGGHVVRPVHVEDERPPFALARGGAVVFGRVAVAASEGNVVDTAVPQR
jgi:hypothetical protein